VLSYHGNSFTKLIQKVLLVSVESRYSKYESEVGAILSFLVNRYRYAILQIRNKSIPISIYVSPIQVSRYISAIHLQEFHLIKITCLQVEKCECHIIVM